jgi:pimeloyl-[acyl-carrier protein] methyl ester esterase
MTIYIEQQGQGPDVVLVHGWGLHGGIWGDLPARLAQHHRVSVVDLPGHGRSRGEPWPRDLPGLAQVVAQQLPAAATWVGWSLGGMLAMTLALQSPAQVARLVLVGSTPRFVQGPDWPAAMHPGLLTQFAEELAQDYRATLQRFLSLQVGMDAAGRAQLKILRHEMFLHGEPDAAALIGGLAILRDTDLRPRLPQIGCPALIVHGGLDRLASVPASLYLASQLPNAQRVCIEHAGHAPFLSHPHAFHALLQDFL